MFATALKHVFVAIVAPVARRLAAAGFVVLAMASIHYDETFAPHVDKFSADWSALSGSVTRLLSKS